MFVRRASIVWALAFATSGCRPQPQVELPLCKAEVATDTEIDADSLSADVWFSILLRNFDRQSMRVRSPVADCTGRPIAAPSELPGAGEACVASGDSAQSERPLTADDLRLTPLSDGRQLAWAKVGFFADGDAVGPVAIAEFSGRGVQVRALGTLRAPAERTSLRLEKVGEVDLLVAEGRSCPQPDSCVRVVKLQTLEGDRFVERPLREKSAAGDCIRGAQIRLSDKSVVALRDQLERTFEAARSLKIEADRVVINEQVTVSDRDPSQPELPAKQFRQASRVRAMTIGADSIVIEEGLWESMLAEHGSVELQTTDAPDSSSL